MSDVADPLDFINGDDQTWWDHTGMCGGCGSVDCHEGRCPTDLCNICPSRIAEGWWRPPTRNGDHSRPAEPERATEGDNT